MSRRSLVLPVALLLAATLVPSGAHAQMPPGMDPNEPGVLEPVTSTLQAREVRIPNTDQSIDGDHQSAVVGDVVFEEALATTSLLGHSIDRVTSPNQDMRSALIRMFLATEENDQDQLEDGARELLDILLGKTEGRIYDGFSMLNYNRWNDTDETGITAAHFPSDAVPDEYKMKVVTDTGERFVSPFDGATRKIWEANVAMLYYDGQIDSDAFLLKFPVEVHPDDTVRVHYRIYSLVEEDFSPTLVMLDRRLQANTVQFPFKGFDAVWIAFFPGQVLNVTLDYPPARMMRGVYTWGWRVHPPRIQFMQPVYEITNQRTGETIWDPQSESYVVRNREELRLDTIGEAAPEKKMYRLAKAIVDGDIDMATADQWMNNPGAGPRGVWQQWADLAEEQRQIPDEAWDVLAAEGIDRGEFGDFQIVSVFMNNEMYGSGPFFNEVRTWQQGETFHVKLINLDAHTHYFRNVDFGPRLHDDIQRCCGGGETSFEIMNFKPSYGAPKVAEMQWRAGWGFRPHFDVIQQGGVFPRGVDRVKTKPYTDGSGELWFGYQYSVDNRRGDFPFSPPPFIIEDGLGQGLNAENPLRDANGETGLIIGQHTEGYGVAKMCPEDSYPGFCATDIAQYNPHGTLNWPPPPLQGVNGNPDHPTELRFPPFLRNPDQGGADAGDIIPPTGAWRPFMWLSPHNGTIYIDPEDHSKGFWADLTYSHGRPVPRNSAVTANIELPRASGQVFYQFDDLFHDNSIFSPHPVFRSLGEPVEADDVLRLRATNRGGALRVRGQLSELRQGGYSDWVTLYVGTTGAEGCSGTVLGVARVDDSNGRFIYRNHNVEDLAPGAELCVESNVKGFASVGVQ